MFATQTEALKSVFHLLTQVESARALAGERDQHLTAKAMDFAREAFTSGNLLATARKLSDVAAHLLGEKAPGSAHANAVYLALVCAPDELRQIHLEN